MLQLIVKKIYFYVKIKSYNKTPIKFPYPSKFKKMDILDPMNLALP